MTTSFLLEQKKIIDNNQIYSDLLNYYRSKYKLLETKDRYVLLEANDSIVINRMMIASTDLSSKKIDFIEFYTKEEAEFDLNVLKNEWGNYKIVDQSERDNTTVIIFNIKSKSSKNVELIIRNGIDGNDLSKILIEAAKFSIHD